MDDAIEMILNEVHVERERQNAKWGVQEHDHGIWSLILTEEVGEAAQEALNVLFSDDAASINRLREELIHTAAVACQWIEYIDRHQGKETH